MIFYLARAYLANTLVFGAAFGLLPILFGGAWTGVLAPALFWGSAAAAGYTYWRFQKKASVAAIRQPSTAARSEKDESENEE